MIQVMQPFVQLRQLLVLKLAMVIYKWPKVQILLERYKTCHVDC